MYGLKEKKLLPRMFILLAQLVYLVIGFLIMRNTDLNLLVEIGMYVFLVITFIRLNAMMFIWLPRGISWAESVGNSFAFALYYIGFPWLAILSNEFNMIVFVLAIIVFIEGSAINTISELLRMPFKKDPNNKGKLYTGGLFKYSVHINYFGDVLWVLGFAMLTMNLYALLIPLMLFLMFQFSYIPKADQYLEKKYGEAFIEYKKNTKTFIPFIL